VRFCFKDYKGSDRVLIFMLLESMQFFQYFMSQMDGCINVFSIAVFEGFKRIYFLLVQSI